jgi:Bacterial Ig-like domain (group 2)/Chitobiase/beta-hexosaminidase C-terminal domain
MRISPPARVCFGLLCGILIFMAGCSSPSSQSLDSLSITATPSTISVGGASVLKAVAHLSDGTTQDVTAGTQFSVSNTALASMSNGAITAKATGTVTVQAAYIEVAPAGTSPASATVTPQNLSASTQVTITAAGSSNVPTITWPTPTPVTYGGGLGGGQLNATANIAGTFTYTPAAGTVLPAGTQTLSVTFTPTDMKTYSAATASVQLIVNQATPSITWPTPAVITPGTALSATQLDATASVPGSFMYNPASGTVLAAGTQLLTAVFSPTDSTDYSSATAQTSLLVGSASSPTPSPTPTPGQPPVGCGGPTINLNSSMNNGALQSAISSAPNCSLIIFAAGTYSITSTINIPCSNLTLTGPAVFPNTAILNATFTGSPIFNLPGGCNGLGLDYLAGYNTGLLYVASGNNTNINILHDTTGGLPSSTSSSIPYGLTGSIYFDGSVNTTLSNVNIEYNSFGDNNSCTAVFTIGVDYGGYCAGVVIHQGLTQDIVVKYNKFFHLENGFKVLQAAGNFAVGQKASVSDNLDVEYNYFLNIHRIEVEIQEGTANHPTIVSNNIFQDQSYSFYGSLGLSTPCCQWSTTSGIAGNNPGLMENNNVSISSLKSQYGCDFCGVTSNSGPAFAHEYWGNGSHGDNNLIQGNFGNGFEWGYGAGSWELKYNQMCGPNMAMNHGNEANFIANEELQSNPPIQVGNVTSATCSAITSVAPSISPASGSGTQTVTLTDPGLTSGAGPQGNTSIYYTTDGSSPVPGSGTTQLYTGPFQMTAPGTVNAVGLYGAGGTSPQTWPTTYPAGLGYVPSSVVSATYTSGSIVHAPAGKAISSNGTNGGTAADAGAAGNGGAGASLQSIAITPSQPVVAIGKTTQLKAVASFSDGSVRDVTAQFAWQSSDPRTLTANASGLLAGLAGGQAVISGSYQGLTTSVPAGSSIGDMEWSAPIVITRGGTYSGNWQSTDSKTAAVTVATTAPVIIENAHVRSVGDLITTSVAGTNLTVRNSLGVAMNATTKGQPNGVFLEVSSPARLDVESNYIENARGGVIVHGYAGNRDGEQTIVIRANRARNLNGLLSDGHGSYLPGEGANHSQARFIQFDTVQSVPGIDVGWNEVINYPGRSLVDDNIDVYRSSGTANRPIEIHDSYIQGAYPYKAAQDAYAGGGIKTEGGANDTDQEAPAFNNIHDNQIVGTVSYGIKFAAGHDNVAANNHVISSGLLTDGTRIAAQDVGLAGGGANATMYNNTMRDNLVGWACWKASCAQEGYRKDQFFPATPADYTSNSVLAGGPVTLNTENYEYQVWLNKISAAGIEVGPSF